MLGSKPMNSIRIFILIFFALTMHISGMAQPMSPAQIQIDTNPLAMPLSPATPSITPQPLPNLTAPAAALPEHFAFAEQPVHDAMAALPETAPLPQQTVQALATPQQTSGLYAPQQNLLPATTPGMSIPPTESVLQQGAPASQFTGLLAATAPQQAPPANVQPGVPNAVQQNLLPVQQQAGTPQQPQQSQQQGTIQIPGLPVVAKEDEGPKEIYLNFENTELSGFINYMAEVKNLNIIPDAALEGAKISLTIREPLSVDGAWNIFLTVLEMAGFSIVKLGEVYKILPKDKKLNQPLPAYINVPASSLPDSDETIRYVFFLTNLQVGDIESLLTSMLSTPNVVISQKEVNGFIITDKSYNIKSAVKLIQELDQMGLPENVTVIKLKNANAVDVKELLKSLIKEPEGNPLARLLGRTSEGKTEYFSSTTRIIPEERTNSLILLGKKDSTDRIIDFITKHIDTELKAADSPLYIYELQHADAAQIRDILKEVTASPDSTAGQSASKYGAIRGGVKYFKAINFDIDKDGNRLIISCPDKQDWRLLKKTIKDLDKPQPQVAIETLIVLVTVSDIKKLGGAIRNKKHGNIGTNIDFQAATSAITSPALQLSNPDDPTSQPISLLGNMFSKLAAETGQAVLAFGKDTNVWAVFRALKSLANTSVLSQPFVTVANKTDANIVVGETKRVVQSTSGDTKGFDDAHANTAIKINPQINPDGIIRLSLEVTIDEFTSSDGTDKTNKNLKTDVTVADGQVLVLGGFVKTKVNESKSKTPFFGEIPIIGWFFKNQERTITKEYTFIFMTPTIVKPRQNPGIQLYTKLKLHQATDEIEAAIETKKAMDPIHNWFFNPDKENYSHKVIDFANARYQPTTVDIKNDPYYRSQTQREEMLTDIKLAAEEKEAREHAAQEQQVSTLEREPIESTPMQAGAPGQPQDMIQHYLNTQTSQPMQAMHIEQPMQQVSQPLQTARQVSPATTPPAAQPPASTPMETGQPMQTVGQQPAQSTPAATPEVPNVTDQELVQRRAQLKALLSQQTPPQPEQQLQTAPQQIIADKRQSFKDLMATTPLQTSQREETTLTEKRNRLKEFLAANPTLAENSAQRLKDRKASA